MSGVFAGRYLVERELGRGGTSIVYLAREEASGRMVAIKVLRDELLTEINTERFLREIQVTARLHHPNVLPVLDSGEHEGRPFFVLPHMDGGTLRDRLDREKQLPIADVLTIGRTIATTLHFAHERHLLHRDVKPENILFGGGQTCLADFGIARALSQSSADATTTGVIRGTPEYMSPEQAAANPDIDRRSDIYSLACVLYEAVAGMPAFIGPTQQSIVAQRLVHVPQRPSVYRPTVSVELEEVLERALAISPADRYQTAAEFAAALESVEPFTRSGSGGVKASAARARRRRFRRPVMTSVIAASVLVLAGVAAVMVPRRRPVSSSAVADGDPRRIAVMYLDDLTPTVLPQYVVDGITEDLIDRLGGVRALRVISPDGVRPFRSKAVAIDSIGRALRVGTIISGSAARSGASLRLNVRLVDAKTGQQLYNQSLEEPWGELFALQDKLSDDVAFVLRQRLGDEIQLRQHRAATRSYAAWETVQIASDATRRALEANNLRNDARAPELFLSADSLYARAESLDPKWIHPTIRRGALALALAFRSPVPPSGVDSLAYARMTPLEQRIVWIRRAIALADDALRRDPSSPEALALRGDARFELMKAIPAASDSLAPLIERDLHDALATRPDAANAWSTLAQLARQRGQFAAAAAAAKRAFEADAFFEVSRIAAIGFMAALHAGATDDAQRWCRTGLAHYPGDPRFSECELTLMGWSASADSDVTRAWQVLGDIERADSVHLLDQTWGYRRLMIAAILARAGAKDSARHVLDAVRAAAPQDPAQRSTWSIEAYVQLLLGDRDGALASLAEYLRMTPLARPQIAQHPWFVSLRNDPRFIALVHPVR